MANRYQTKKGDYFTQYVINDVFCCGTIEEVEKKVEQHEYDDNVKIVKEKCLVVQNNASDFVYEVTKEEEQKPYLNIAPEEECEHDYNYKEYEDEAGDYWIDGICKKCGYHNRQQDLKRYN